MRPRTAPLISHCVSALQRAIENLTGRTRILVFTGAGISTESGIPDFRGPDGLWTRFDPSEFTLRKWVGDAGFRQRAWERRFAVDFDQFDSNDGHRAVAGLWETGLMIGCITQNIDGLHQAGGLPDNAVAEIHGNVRGLRCYEQGHPADRARVKARWESGEVDPHCDQCGSILKSTTVLFGENLPEHAVGRAQQWTDDADAVLAIGSTLSVFPAADFPLQIAARGDPFVIVNRGETDHDRIADVKVDGKAGEVVPAIVAALSR